MKNKISGVYSLKALNKKLIYIGSTQDLTHRKATHMYAIRISDKSRGCAAMIEASEEGDFVEFETLEITEDLFSREQYWIDFYKNQDVYELINRFDADRVGGKANDVFKNKLSEVRRNKWKEEEYRNNTVERLSKHSFANGQLNKKVHQFTLSGEYTATFESVKAAAIYIGANQITLSATSRGIKTFKHKGFIFIYDEVLNKLGELLELHHELRTISSEAWEACKNTTNVQRLIDEQSSNNSNTSAQQL